VQAIEVAAAEVVEQAYLAVRNVSMSLLHPAS